MRRMVLAAALLALVAVSCKAEINLAVDLQADGSGTLVVETGFDEEFREFAFQGTDPEEEIFADNALADLEGAEFSTYEEGEFTFYAITTPFDSVETLEGELLGAAGDDAPVDTIDVTVTDDEVRVSAQTADAADALVSGEDLEGFDLDILADTIAIHFRVTMPGEVTSHNATRVLDDGTLEWDIPLTGAGLDIQAVSDPNAGSGGGVPAWLVGAAAVVLIAGAGVYAMRRRKGGDDDAVPEAVPVGAVAAGAATASAAGPEVGAETRQLGDLPPAPPVDASAEPEPEIPVGEDDETPPLS